MTCPSCAATRALAVLLHFCGAHEAATTSFPFAVKFDSQANSSCKGGGQDGRCLLQKQFKVGARQKVLDGEDDNSERAAGESKLFRWGVEAEGVHPRSIGKWAPHPRIQDYEVHAPRFGGMVLNIFGKMSNGDGGLLIALEVPSLCEPGAWMEVDRSRCSSKYPCTLRLPSGAVSGIEDQPTRFRTIVRTEDEDYLTDVLEYDRVTLDQDPQVIVTHESWVDNPDVRKAIRFNLSTLLSSGPLTVSPIVQGGTADTAISMKIRQPDPPPSAALAQSEEQAESGEMSFQKFEATLQSYRAHWSGEWRAASKTIGGCESSNFEVGADQLYPGDIELEVWVEGPGVISDVLVHARMSWAEAEVALLDTIMKDHFSFFNDPDEIVHGLPMDALKKENPGQLTDSNPCEWGYAMESWIIMSETGVLNSAETVAKLTETFQTLEKLQSDTSQFAHGLFYPYYRLRSKEGGGKVFPQATECKELPCGDDALLYASMMMVQGWLRLNSFPGEADTCAQILGRMDFSQCLRKTDCNAAGNGLQEAQDGAQGDQFWSVPLTFHADTKQQNSFSWNVWADEGGVVSMIVALSGAVSDEQYESIVHQQQRYSPCVHWDGVTVGHASFFNSIFTLPTRSILGFGTLFSSPYYHEFTVRSVLPTFRGHQKLKRKLGVDYIGPSDAMTAMPRKHPGKFYGSYAYWPPNNMYDCREGRTTKENQCTWCDGKQYEGLDDEFDTIVPHGNMASFLVAAVMEKTLFTAWLEDTKLLMTDWSEVYKPGYGLEVVAPAKRTPRGGKFEGAYDGRGVWEALSHGYTVLSMYEGLATMRRRFEMAKAAGLEIPGSYEPPNYKPLSDFVSSLPQTRAKINRLLTTAWQQKSTEKQCAPSDYGPSGHSI